jgi:hypothetical protein
MEFVITMNAITELGSVLNAQVNTMEAALYHLLNTNKQKSRVFLRTWSTVQWYSSFVEPVFVQFAFQWIWSWFASLYHNLAREKPTEFKLEF